MGTILIIILVLVLVGALPTWPRGRELGILSQRRNRFDPSDPDHPAAPWEDLRCSRR